MASRNTSAAASNESVVAPLPFPTGRADRWSGRSGRLPGCGDLDSGTTGGHRWRIGRLCRECSKARDASGREGAAREPSSNTVESEGRSGRDVLQARLGQAAVARSAQTEGPHALGQRTFHALALRVEAPAFRRALPGPGRSEGLVFALRKKGEHATVAAQTRPGAAGPGRAGATVGGSEPGPDRAPLARALGALEPARALLALRAARYAPVPVHGEVGGAECCLGAALPALVRTGRANQVDAVLLVGHDEVVSADIS